MTVNDNGVFYDGRTCAMVYDFYAPGTFESLNKAHTWLHENGFSYGSLCMDQPVGILHGDFLIAKWKNLSSDDIQALHGVLLSEDFREGACKILIFEPQE
jgi:hypothetical protein